MAWMWCSFADPDLPAGQQFLGVAIVEAEDVVTAAMQAHLLGINPGGEVMGVLLPDDLLPPEHWRNRLLTREEAELAGGESPLH